MISPTVHSIETKNQPNKDDDLPAAKSSPSSVLGQDYTRITNVDSELTYQADASTASEWTLEGRDKSQAHMVLAARLSIPQAGSIARRAALMATCSKSRLEREREELSVALAFADLRQAIDNLVRSIPDCEEALPEAGPDDLPFAQVV